jgi:hypothetical protein
MRRKCSVALSLTEAGRKFLEGTFPEMGVFSVRVCVCVCVCVWLGTLLSIGLGGLLKHRLLCVSGMQSGGFVALGWEGKAQGRREGWKEVGEERTGVWVRRHVIFAS